MHVPLPCQIWTGLAGFLRHVLVSSEQRLRCTKSCTNSWKSPGSTEEQVHLRPVKPLANTTPTSSGEVYLLPVQWDILSGYFSGKLDTSTLTTSTSVAGESPDFTPTRLSTRPTLPPVDSAYGCFIHVEQVQVIPHGANPRTSPQHGNAANTQLA